MINKLVKSMGRPFLMLSLEWRKEALRLSEKLEKQRLRGVGWRE